MKHLRLTATVFQAAILAGCASIDFGKDGLTYYDPIPALLVATACDKDASTITTTATIVVLPGDKKSLKLRNGFGSSNLTVTLSNGMIVSVGQESDSKIPETLTALGGLGAATILEDNCKPQVTLYRIEKTDKIDDVSLVEIPFRTANAENQ